MEFITAVKERVVGAVEENVGYLTGNHDMEARGREMKEHGKELAQSFYEQAGHIKSDDTSSENKGQDQSSVMDKLRDAHTEAMNKSDEQSSSSSPSTSWVNPSLFSRNQPDPKSSAFGAAQDQQHSDLQVHYNPTTAHVTDKPEVKPINVNAESPLPETRDQWSKGETTTDESVGSKWMDKLGAIMSGKKDDDGVWTNNNNDMDAKDDQKESVMDRLRNAHAEAISQQDNKGVTETIKEKFDNWSHSASTMMTGKSEQGLTDKVQDKVSDMKETVQDKVGEVKDQVSAMWNQEEPSSDLPTPTIAPLPPKLDKEVGTPIPDTNFLQNA